MSSNDRNNGKSKDLNANRKVIGVMGISNNTSYNIYEFEHGIENKVLGGLSGQTPRWRKLYVSVTKGDYFMVNGVRYYLCDFMRV